MDKDIFVQNVEILCLRKGIKPTNACKESGVGGSFLSDIKRGRDPSTKKVQMLAQYLGCTVSDLLGERAVSESGTVSADELRHLLAYRKAPAPIREIVDTALKPYEA